MLRDILLHGFCRLPSRHESDFALVINPDETTLILNAKSQPVPCADWCVFSQQGVESRARNHSYKGKNLFAEGGCTRFP